MGLTQTDWLAFAGLLLSVAAGASQVWYWLTARQREAAEKARLKAAADIAKKEIADAAELARIVTQTTARQDALQEWQKLYGEKDRQVVCLMDQNQYQQTQINELKDGQQHCQDQHRECEESRVRDKAAADAKHRELEGKIADLSGAVTKIANGTEKHP